LGVKIFDGPKTSQIDEKMTQNDLLYSHLADCKKPPPVATPKFKGIFFDDPKTSLIDGK